MSPNRTSEWNVMTIRICRELLLFDFERLDITWASIIHPSQKLWPFELAKSVIVLFWGSQYITRLNLTSEWKVMTTLIVRELPLFNFERLNISWASIIYPSQKLTSFEFVESFYVHFWLSQYITCLNLTSEWKVMTIWITRELPLLNFERLDMLCAWIGHASENLWPFAFLDKILCSISSVSIRYAHESDMRVKSYDHLNFLRSSVVQFRASPYVMCLNWISVWKVMTIWISREVPLFIVERPDISWASYIHPCEKL